MKITFVIISALAVVLVPIVADGFQKRVVKNQWTLPMKPMIQEDATVRINVRKETENHRTGTIIAVAKTNPITCTENPNTETTNDSNMSAIQTRFAINPPKRKTGKNNSPK